MTSQCAASHRRRREQVWLPGLQVWAVVGGRNATHTSSAPRLVKSRRKETSMSVISSPGQNTALAQPSDLVEACASTEDVKAGLVAQAAIQEDFDSLPTCPICNLDVWHPYWPPSYLGFVLRQAGCDCRSDRDTQARQGSTEQLHACLLC